MIQKTIITLFIMIIAIIIGIGLISYLTNNNPEDNTNNQVPGGPVAVLETTNLNQNINMPENISSTTTTQAIIKTNLGNITIQFYNEDAPKTVANFVKLASTGFYNGIKFHRVIKDFMIQAGDPLTKDNTLKDRWGTGGPGYQFADEINNRKLVKGSLAMANSGPDTNGSQFFIVTTASTPWLDGKHTNFGQVIEGQNIIDLIANTQTAELDRPVNDIIINSIELK